jgi:hypothetical protein
MNATLFILVFWCGCSLGGLLTYRWLRHQANPHEIQKFPKMWLLTSCGVVAFALISLLIPAKAQFGFALGGYLLMAIVFSRRTA